MRIIGLAITALCFLLTAAPVFKTLPKPLIPQPGALKLSYTPGMASEQKQELVIINNDNTSIKHADEATNSPCSCCSNTTTTWPTMFPIIAPAANIIPNSTQQQDNGQDKDKYRHTKYHSGYYYPKYNHGEWRLAADGKYWWYPTLPVYSYGSCKNNNR